jgi:hypothetical protein
VTSSTSELCWRFFSVLATGTSRGPVLGRLIFVAGRLGGLLRRLVALGL